MSYTLNQSLIQFHLWLWKGKLTESKKKIKIQGQLSTKSLSEDNHLCLADISTASIAAAAHN